MAAAIGEIEGEDTRTRQRALQQKGWIIRSNDHALHGKQISRAEGMAANGLQQKQSTKVTNNMTAPDSLVHKQEQ